MQPTLSEAPVNALLHPNGEVRICGPLKYPANDQGNVLVKFGTEKQFEQAEEKACYEGEILNRVQSSLTRRRICVWRK